MKQLPIWRIPATAPASFDMESLTAIEQAARLYEAMFQLINEYNAFAAEVNKDITDFTSSSETEIQNFKAYTEQRIVCEFNRIQQEYDALQTEIRKYNAEKNDELLANAAKVIDEGLKNGSIVIDSFVDEEARRHILRMDNPHGVTAAQVGARPATWTPTAAEVGARPATWTPTAAQVGARPDTWTPTAAEVGARPDTWTPTAAEVGARPATWTPTAEEIGAFKMEYVTGGLAAFSRNLGGISNVRFRTSAYLILVCRLTGAAASTTAVYVVAGYNEYRAPILTQLSAGTGIEVKVEGDNTNGWYVNVGCTNAAGAVMYLLGNCIPTFEG